MSLKSSFKEKELKNTGKERREAPYCFRDANIQSWLPAEVKSCIDCEENARIEKSAYYVAQN